MSLSAEPTNTRPLTTAGDVAVWPEAPVLWIQSAAPVAASNAKTVPASAPA